MNSHLGVQLNELDVALLTQWANVYLIFRHNVDRAPRTAVRVQLEKLRDHPATFSDLANLDDATRGLLAFAMHRLPTGYPADPVVHWERAPGHAKLTLSERYPELIRAELFRKSASLAVELFAERRLAVRGRRVLFALRWYIEQLARFYFEQTGRRPRRAYDHRQKINREAGRFLGFVTTALRPVDSKAASRCAYAVRLACADFERRSSEGIQSP